MSYEELIAFGLIVLKLRRDDLEWLTPFEYSCCIDVYNEKIEFESNSRYEQERFNVWLNLASQSKKQFSQVDLIRFPWEPLQKAKVTYGRQADTISKTKPTVRRGESEAKS